MLLSVWSLLFFLNLITASPIPAPGPQTANLVKRQTTLNAFLSVLLDYLPQVDGTIETVVGVLTSFERLVALLTGEQTTYNELGGPCKKYTVIFARGTTEPGNVGILVGPPFFEALKSLVGASEVTIQGVNNYDASIDGYLEGGDPGGSAFMAAQIEHAYDICPDTNLVVSGYSQGGQIVHNAANILPEAIGQWISSAVIFGDPDNGTAVANVPASRTDIFCNQGDDICVNGDLILAAHLTYGEDANAAAAFVVATAAA